MRLDPVHDLQKVFRKVLAAMASPGEILDLSDEAELLDVDLPLNKGILLVALALLDAETSFCVASADSAEQAKAISQMTYAKPGRADEADYVFVLGTHGSAEAIVAAKPGSLIDPHLGATVIIEARSLIDGDSLVLSGPGIEATRRLDVDLDAAWIAARTAKNVEFPLGIDLILVDSSCRLAALPRTTRIGEEG